MKTGTLVLKNRYVDSVALMAATNQLKERSGVEDAAMMMGTDVNKELLAQGGLLTEDAQTAQANDLIIAIRSGADMQPLLEEAQSLLTARSVDAEKTASLPETVRAAKRISPHLNLTVISVGGAYAAREAREALAAGMHVLLFSDNVSLQDEVDLKRFARQQDLLLMGPGAGTAILNGIGLGFANAVPRGPVGIVSAAGTGLQEVSTLIAKRGVGVSQAIGTGGRDLSRAVGGLTFFAGVDALQADDQTRVLALISKPPDPQVTRQLLEKIADLSKPTVLCLLGADVPDSINENLHFTRTLEECAYTSAALAQDAELDVRDFLRKEDAGLSEFIQMTRDVFSDEQHNIRALYSGGTLCYEAQVIWKDLLSQPVYSNAPLEKKYQLADAWHSKGHTAVDLGEEEFTLGRPHPMIDNTLRIQRMQQEVRDKQTAIILLDVVIGYGAHPDPAAELGEAIQHLRAENFSGQTVVFIASVTGSEQDPQGYTRSAALLQESGIFVCKSNAQATRLAAALVEGE